MPSQCINEAGQTLRHSSHAHANTAVARLSQAWGLSTWHPSVLYTQLPNLAASALKMMARRAAKKKPSHLGDDLSAVADISRRSGTCRCYTYECWQGLEGASSQGSHIQLLITAAVTFILTALCMA